MSINLDRLLADGCATQAAHKVCRSRGGESCAFDGAAIVLMPIADAAHVVHGPIACCGNAWEGRGVHSSAGELHKRGFTSDIQELDIVYGGEKLLEATVREVVEAEQPKAVFVYATCVTGLIGEDIDAACKRLSAQLWVPVIPVSSPGFVGPKNLGNRIAGETLLEHVIGTAEPACTTPTDITLIGEYNVAGDLDLVEPLLRECGIRVLSRLTGNASFEEIRWAHRAKASAVVCSRALINVASGLTRRWGVPAVEVSFFGATEIARSLRAIADVLEATVPEALGVRERVDSVIAAREEWLRERLSPYSALKGKKAVLYSGGVKSWSMASALQDLGIEILAVGTKKSTHEDEQKAREVLGPDARLIEDISPAVIRGLFAEEGAQLLVAGGRNRYLAAKEGWPFIDVNQEREHAYAGYEGLVSIARDLTVSIAYHERELALGASCGAPRKPTPVVKEQRTAVIDPLKNAPSLGAVLALQGVHRALPVIHSAQGCSFLGKVALINHFNEPISLASTALFTEQVVMGSEEAVIGTVGKHLQGAAPELVGVVSAALAEVKGDDIDSAVRQLGQCSDTAVIAVHAPDYEGGLEEGHAAAVSALVGVAEDVGARAGSRRDRLTVLVGAHLTPGDVSWLRDTVEEFGLTPTMIPDLSSLDGSRLGLSPLSEGGVSVAQLRSLGLNAHTIVVGGSLEGVARSIRDRFGTPYTAFEAVHGVAATDLLLTALSLLSGLPVPAHHERDRRVLIDAMRDAHLELGGRRVTLALEPDHALSVSALFDEVTAQVDAVVPTSPAHAARIQARQVVVGDFASVSDETELLVGSSHARRTASVCGAVHFETGYPVFSHYGASRHVTVGYRGATFMVDTAANLLAQRERTQRHPATERSPR